MSLAADEVPFAFDELFFSRTDPGGIILSGNSVFTRVSGYSWEELDHKPHKMVRHPDMLRGVFWLFWDAIRQGKPIGAYVKNRTKDGRYYWVFALATPVDGGFLSVRFKPSSEIFQIVQREYAALLLAERDLKPEQSAQLLLARLKELGFADYPAFMSAALAAELAACDIKRGRPADTRLASCAEIAAASTSLLEQAGAIFGAYTENAYVSLNFQVQAAQLGEAGAAIGEISRNYDMISAAIKKNMERFVAEAGQVVAIVDEGRFLLGATQLQREMHVYFQHESASSTADHSQDMALLEKQMRRYGELAIEGLRRIAQQAMQFRAEYIDMKRLATGLEVTRIMGKVESARLNHLNHGLDGLIDELEHLQRAIAGGLKAIDQLNQRIQRDTDGLILQTAA